MPPFPSSAGKNYTCEICWNEFAAELMVTRQVRYRQLGQAGRVVKSTNVGNVCLHCVDATPSWLERAQPLTIYAENLRLRRELSEAKATGESALHPDVKRVQETKG